MFALYKTSQYLVCKLSTHFKFFLGHNGDITILRFLQDLANFTESAEVKYNRWLNNITSNFDFQRKLFNSFQYNELLIPFMLKLENIEDLKGNYVKQ